MAECYDCARPYDDAGFCDLIIPLEVWERISPTGDEGGTLCACCICSRLVIEGIRDVPGAFMSGPIRTVSPELMQVLRQVENMRLGRDFGMLELIERGVGGAVMSACQGQPDKGLHREEAKDG